MHMWRVGTLWLTLAAVLACSPSDLKLRDEECEQLCRSSGCDLALLGDGSCHQQCDNEVCSWDLGDCGVCASRCFQSLLDNDQCDAVCNFPACNWDSESCECAPRCSHGDRTSTATSLLCCSAQCSYQQGNADCVSGHCATGCANSMVNDGQCDLPCLRDECMWDGGDCNCSAGCDLDMLADGHCDPECAVAGCEFDGGDCTSSVLFVGYKPNGNGSGHTSDNAASSLTDVMSRVTTPSATIYLLAGVYPLNAPTQTDLLENPLQPLSRTDSSQQPISLLITTLLCSPSNPPHCADSPATVQLTSSFLRFYVSGELRLQHIILDGSVSLKSGCSSCVHCPRLRLSYGETVDDRGAYLPEWSVPAQSQCDAYHSYVLFTVAGSFAATVFLT